MIWIDILEPKYSTMFSEIIPLLKDKGHKIVVTTRFNEDYKESSELLTLNNIEHYCFGGYGTTLEEKLLNRIEREKSFLELFKTIGKPKLLLSGASVDAIQTASAIGIPNINFADTPLRHYEFSYDDITFVSKLTFPLSDIVLHPFVVPAEVYHKIGVDPKKTIQYDFIDVCLWMDKIVKIPDNDFRIKYGIDVTKLTILIREEEFKANYVKEKLPVIYEVITQLCEFEYNVVIMPRYEVAPLKELFPKATILEEKIKPQEFYPFIDLLIGGGGTMNLEASYYGIPVISTRSFNLFHDKYLIDHLAMHWSNDCDEIVKLSHELVGKKLCNKSIFYQGSIGLDKIFDVIERFV